MKKTTPITTLELRTNEIPRSRMIEMLEQRLGRPFTHEHSYYLANTPVNCGDLLERYDEGRWHLGRFEWSGRIDELPTFHMAQTIITLNRNDLMRWPPTSS